MRISKRKDNLAEEKLKVIEQTDGQMCGDGIMMLTTWHMSISNTGEKRDKNC